MRINVIAGNFISIPIDWGGSAVFDPKSTSITFKWKVDEKNNAYITELLDVYANRFFDIKQNASIWIMQIKSPFEIK